MSRNILINNVYSYRNKGDSAIIEAMMAYVREVCPSARITLLSNFWRENTEYYKARGTDGAPHLWDIPMDDAKLRRAVRGKNNAWCWPPKRPHSRHQFPHHGSLSQRRCPL